MKTILIVDDHPEVRALLHMTLELAQTFQMHEAKDGEEAVIRALELKPDLVLMDIMMPGPIDGIQASQRIKDQAGAFAPKVILVSAMPWEVVKPRWAESKADLFLAKPFGPAQLVEKLTALYR